jgi:hypothetical protein
MRDRRERPAAVRPDRAAPAEPRHRAPGGLLGLQRSAGNQATCGWLAGGGAPVVQRDPQPTPSGTVGEQAAALVRAGSWTPAMQLLNSQAMPQLLAALDALRVAGLLAQVADHVDSTPGISAPRMWAATLAAQLHLGHRFARYAITLPDDQRNAITSYCLARITAGGAPDRLRRTGDGQVFTPVGPIDNAEFVRRFLSFYQLATPPIRDPSGQRATFNGQETTMVDVIDTVVEQAALSGILLTTAEVTPTAADSYQAARGNPISPHIALAYSFVPTTGHLDPSGGPIPADQAGHQLGGTFTVQLHRSDEPGLEFSAVVNMTFFADQAGSRIRLQNVQGGGQAAWVVPFARGFLLPLPGQYSVFGQAVAGAAWRQHEIAGSTVITADPAAQVGVGGQLQFTVLDMGRGGQLQIGGQLGLASTWTKPPNGPTGPVRDQPGHTYDLGGNFFLQWQPF